MKKANNNENINKVSAIKVKKAVLEVLEVLEDRLDTEKRDVTMVYDVIGKETEQAKHWKTGELKWDDEEQTIPHYDNVYDYVDKKPEQYTDDDFAKLEAIETIRKALYELI